MKILIAEDEAVSRRLLQRNLERWGHQVLAAPNGLEAWNLLVKNDVHLVVADWMMPDMDGVTLCRKIREANLPSYVYFILLTAKNQKEDVVKGLEAGADDYVTKPFEPNELCVRIRAGERIVQLQQTLLENNKHLKAANETMRADLEAARETQLSLLPQAFPDMSNIEFAARFIPSAFVSGDIYNIFRLDEKHLGFYHIDVSGHGVPAALFCVSIHQRMTHDLHHHGLLKVPVGEPPYYRINPPDRVVAILNEDEMLEQHGRYFTMFYGILNTETAVLSFCRAGHNLPLLIHGNGVAQYLDGGGGPIGFGFPRQPNEGQELNLTPGDCFVIFSDGINEAPSAADRTSHYGMERVQNLLAKHLSDPLSQSFDRLVADVKTFSGKDTFDDDVSIVGFRWLGKG